MRKSILILALVSFEVNVRAEPAADDHVAKNMAARGGEAKLKDVKTIRFTGKLHFGGGDFSVDAVWGQVAKRLGMMRSEVTLQGLTQVNAFDGRDGWSVQPFGGRRDPERASADVAKGMAQQAEFDGPLAGWHNKGHHIEYLGT